MDVAVIGSLLGSLKTATEIAKFIKESDVSLEKAETKMKLAELVSALADAKLEAADIQHAILDRDEKIRELERVAKIKASVKWQAPIYTVTSDEGVDEPYCQHCYDADGKLVRLHTDNAGLYMCRVCDKNFRTLERLQRESAALKSQNGRRVAGRFI